MCDNKIKITNKEFIEHSKKSQDAIYDYSKLIFTSLRNKVIIGCEKHGYFEQVAYSHYKGHGCDKCRAEKVKKNLSSTTEQFIFKAIKIHGYRYDYSKVNYINSKTKIIIICREHGEFEQIPNSHLRGINCRKCGSIKIAESKRLTQEQYVARASEAHNNSFDYSDTEYVGNKMEITITCKIHGNFRQIAGNHIKSRGCKECNKKELNFKKAVKNWRGFIRKAYLKNFYKKKSTVYELLGCDWQTFKEHLENNPYGFKVGDNDIDLDHIIPLSKVDSIIELKKLFHYKNYQLLPQYYNRNVKRNNEFDLNCFKNWISKNINN